MNPRTNWFYQRAEGDFSARTFNAVHVSTGKEAIAFIHRDKILWDGRVVDISELQFMDEIPYAEMQKKIYGGGYYGWGARAHAADPSHLPSFVQ